MSSVFLTLVFQIQESPDKNRLSGLNEETKQPLAEGSYAGAPGQSYLSSKMQTKSSEACYKSSPNATQATGWLTMWPGCGEPRSAAQSCPPNGARGWLGWGRGSRHQPIPPLEGAPRWAFSGPGLTLGRPPTLPCPPPCAHPGARVQVWEVWGPRLVSHLTVKRPLIGTVFSWPWMPLRNRGPSEVFVRPAPRSPAAAP